MKTSDDKDTTSSRQNSFDPKGALDAAGFFDDTSQGLDYLNNLLAAPPQMHLDFGEIRFVPRTSDDSGYVDPVAAGSDRDNIVYFEAERVKLELKELRNENEELKLKIARLFAMTNEIECTQDSLSLENRTLRAQIDDLHRQLETTRLDLQQATEQLAEYASVTAEESAHLDAEPEPEHVQEPEPAPEVSDEVIELSEELVTPHVEESLSLPPEIPEDPPVIQESAPPETMVTIEIPAEPAVIVQAPEAAERQCSGVAPDTAIISRIMAASDEPKEQRPKGPAVFSSKSTVFNTSAHKARPVSKILKPDQFKKHQSNHKPAAHSAPAAQPPAAETAAASQKVEPPKPVFAPPPLMELPETEQTALPKDDKNTQNLVGVDELDLEVGPTPKVAIKQQVKMYRTIQEEADTIPAENKRHTIEL